MTLAAPTRFVPAPDQYPWTFGGYPRVMRVARGNVLDLFTEDCFGGGIRKIDHLLSTNMRKRYLPRNVECLRGAHARLREIGRAVLGAR
jgi:hypothetical protein